MDRLAKELRLLNFSYLPSQGNFLTFQVPGTGAKWQSQLLKKGIVLRPLEPYAMPSHLRWTIGLPDENNAVLAALNEILSMEKLD